MVPSVSSSSRVSNNSSHKLKRMAKQHHMMTTTQPSLQAKRQYQAPEKTVANPTQLDVLCGRGKQCFHHEGNNRFRMLIAENADTYKFAPTKKDKMQCIRLTAETIIARGGRFLVQNKNGSWIDGGMAVGRKKTGHAFRDALRGRVKCITKMREDNALRASMSAKADDSSEASPYSESSEEFEVLESGHSELTGSAPPNSRIEPAKDWMNTTIDNDVATDLFNFFIAY